MPGPFAEKPSDELRTVVEELLPELDRIIGWVGRRHCLDRDARDELRSRVHLRLLDDEQRVLRRFSGGCRLSTYLGCVVQNVARDYRTERWGRWRHSAAAERAGVVAVQLETLRDRDGFSLDETIEILRANRGVRLGRQEVAELAARLPPRATRREEQFERATGLAGSESANGKMRVTESRKTLRATGDALREALRELPVEDRLILRMHYESGLTIASIASALGLEQRPLYTRRDRCLRRLRQALEQRGLEAGDVLAALGWSAAEFEVPYDPDADPGSDS